jgi:copper chaperone CopZ
MKNLKYTYFALALFGFMITQSSVRAQESKKPNRNAMATFQVLGVCGECKERIETAANIKGVKFAEWNKQNDALKVVYNEKKTDLAAIQKAVSEAGHDTQMFKADSANYYNLPKCCQYHEAEKH